MSEREQRSNKMSSERGRLAPRKLAHIVRRTSRYDEMIEWYRLVLGAEVVHSDPMLAFLTYDDEHHRIAIIHLPGLEEQSSGTAGTDHVAFTYDDLGDLLYTYERLKQQGIEPYWCINHGPTTSLYYKDPDANRIELQIDNFATAEECNAWMKKSEFSANPVGVLFDADDLVARYRSGEALSSLCARPPLPEGASPLEMIRF